MANYKILISEKAETQIEDGFIYYNFISKKISKNFLSQIEVCLQYIERNPYLFSKKFKPFRQVKLKKYPFIIIYSVESNNDIVISSVFNTHLNPKKKFK